MIVFPPPEAAQKLPVPLATVPVPHLLPCPDRIHNVSVPVCEYPAVGKRRGTKVMFPSHAAAADKMLEIVVTFNYQRDELHPACVVSL
jgi:hypothetical protein